jgi:nuclear transport factor 2 (NTF2) superfamily protein
MPAESNLPIFGGTSKLIKKLIMEQKYPLPPFNIETAKQKVQMAEDAWNTKDAVKVSQAYTIDSEWRNRTSFVNGRNEIVKFLTEKWEREHQYKLKKGLWAFTDNRIAVRFEYEFCNNDGQWFRAYGNENWEFDENGLMQKRYASINDLPIEETERRIF